MITDFLSAMRSYGSAIPDIRRYGLVKYLIISGLISLAIGLIIFFLILGFHDDISEIILGWIPFLEDSKTFESMIDILVIVILVLIALISYRYLYIIFCAPVLSLMSEELEIKKYSGEIPRLGLLENISLIFRGLRIAIRLIFKELLYSILILLAGFIPAVGLISSPLLLLVQSYYAGFGNMDFCLERRFSVGESVQFVKRHRGLAVGNGLVFIFLLSIPVLGFLIAPALSTVASTNDILKKLDAKE